MPVIAWQFLGPAVFFFSWPALCDMTTVKQCNRLGEGPYENPKQSIFRGLISHLRVFSSLRARNGSA
jgi:hypothetical protein